MAALLAAAAAGARPALASTATPAVAEPVAAAAPAASAVVFYDGSFECYAGPLALHLPDTYRELLGLGPVVEVRQDRVQTYRGFRTIERSIVLRGLTITVYSFASEPNRYQLVRAHISAPGWRVSPLQVGRSARASLRVTGWPAPPHDGAWEMQGDTAHVTVTVRAGRIFDVNYVCDPG